MKNLSILEEQFSNLKLNNTQLAVIKGGDDKRGGFPGGPGKPPGAGTHGGTCSW